MEDLIRVCLYKDKTVSKSLSPLPLNPITILSSEEKFFISWGKYPITCAGSNAGIIPSVEQSSLKPLIAISSSAETYVALSVSFKYACSGPTPG